MNLIGDKLYPVAPRPMRHWLQEWDQRACKSRIEAAGLTEHLMRGVERQVGGETAHVPNWQDLWTYYSIIRETKPDLILEYGSGATTILLAQAVLENGTGKIISIENIPAWGQLTLDRLSSKARTVVELVICEPRVVTKTGFFDSRMEAWARRKKQGKNYRWRSVDRPDSVAVLGLTYQEAAELRPNFILLDGPNPRWTSVYRDSYGSVPPPIVLDPLLYEESYPEGLNMLVDWRPSNTRFLVGNLTRNWRFSTSPVRKLNRFTLVHENA